MPADIQDQILALDWSFLRVACGFREARGVLGSACFAQSPVGELVEQQEEEKENVLGGAGEARSTVGTGGLGGDGRCLHEWVRLHSSTLNNLGIAHRDRAR
jgi:hypothetical protein